MSGLIWDDEAATDTKLASAPPAKELPSTFAMRAAPYVNFARDHGLDIVQGVVDPAGTVGRVIGGSIPDAAREIATPGFVDRTAANLRANIRAGFETAPLMGRSFTLAQQYEPLMEAINRGKPLSQHLPNPYVVSSLSIYAHMAFDPFGAVIEAGRQAITGEDAGREHLENLVWARVEEMRARDPGAFGNLPRDRGDLLELADYEQRSALDYADALARDADGPIGRYVAPFAGQAIGQQADPENILALGLGAPAANTIAGTFLREALVNAAITGAVLPFQMQQQHDLGRDMTAEDAALEVGGAGVLGGVLGVGGRIASHVLDKLLAGPPQVRAAGRYLDDASNRAEDNPFADSDMGRDEHRAALLDTERALDDRNPSALPDVPPMLGRALNIDLEAAQRSAGFSIQSRDPRTVGTDAASMQYKGGADDAGVTDRLKGVEHWDPVKAGLSLWYERADGSVIVADGHQRLGLATRISEAQGAAVPYFGITYREADGVTAQQMRAIAALKNIAEGSGSPIDAARVLRDAPEGVTQLPPRSPLVRQAKDLLALGDDAWGMTVNGHASERDAAIVGRHVKDPAMQAAILGHLAKDSPDTATEAELFVRQALAAGASREIQTDMFGSFLTADLILPLRVKILANALSQLRRDKALFVTLTEKAGAIEAAGNRLNAAENEARQQTAAKAFAMVAALAERKGPISDALQAAAEDAARTGDRRAATGRFLADVRGRLEDGSIDRDLAGGTVGDVEPAPEAAPVPESDRATAGLDLFGNPVAKPEAFRAQADDLARELSPPDHIPAKDIPAGDTAAPEFGEAQAQIDALRALPQDAEFPAGDLFGKGENTSITVKEARAEIERQARAVERLRGCVEGGE